MGESITIERQPRKMPWFAALWLWIIIGFSGLGAIAFLFFNHIVIDKNEPRPSTSLALFYVVDDIASIVLAAAILRWRKWGVIGLPLKLAIVMAGSYLLFRFSPTPWGIIEFVVLLLVLNFGGANSVWKQIFRP